VCVCVSERVSESETTDGKWVVWGMCVGERERVCVSGRVSESETTDGKCGVLGMCVCV